MRAAVLTGPRALELLERDAPPPQPHEVAVRVESIGICGTDLSIYAGKIPVAYPRVMGHEIVGTLASGDRSGERILVDAHHVSVVIAAFPLRNTPASTASCIASAAPSMSPRSVAIVTAGCASS